MPAAAILPPAAPPVSSADGAAFTGIGQISLTDRCTASLIDTGVDGAPAYVLTNGHCAAGRDAGANEVVTGEPATGEVRFAPFADDPDGLATLAVTEVSYSTMKGLDVTVARLGVTLGEARAAGLLPLAIAGAAARPGAHVTNVGVPVQGLAEGEWVLRRGDCTLGTQVDLIEFVWHFDGSWSNDCPGIRGGSSGSPLLDGDGRLVAMINTTTAGAHPDGGDCYLGKPCEVTDAGVRAVPDRAYAVPVAGIERCFDDGGVFSLAAPGCVLDGAGVSSQIDGRAIRPRAAGATATTSAVIEGPAGADEAGNRATPYSQVIDEHDDYGGPEPTTLEVSGMVLYRERIAMPPGALVSVRVSDTSLADAPAPVVAEQVIEPEHQVPIPFSLELDPALDERHQYSLSARITVDGQLWWISDTLVPVSPSGPTTDVVLVLTRVAGEQSVTAPVAGPDSR